MTRNALPRAEPQHPLQCNQAEAPFWCKFSPILPSPPSSPAGVFLPPLLAPTQLQFWGAVI